MTDRCSTVWLQRLHAAFKCRSVIWNTAFQVSACWGLRLWWLLRDRLFTKLNDVCLHVEQFGVRTGRAPTPADCLCSFWRPTTFHWHQFRQERHNRHVWVFSYCKYFFSCQLPSLPALTFWGGVVSDTFRQRRFNLSGKKLSLSKNVSNMRGGWSRREQRAPIYPVD